MYINFSLDNIYPKDIMEYMTPDELKQWRHSNDFTQARLAKVLGVGQVCIARWETGVRKIPPFLHLALRCLELEGGELTEGNRKGKGGVKNG